MSKSSEIADAITTDLNTEFSAELTATRAWSVVTQSADIPTYGTSKALVQVIPGTQTRTTVARSPQVQTDRDIQIAIKWRIDPTSLTEGDAVEDLFERILTRLRGLALTGIDYTWIGSEIVQLVDYQEIQNTSIFQGVATITYRGIE